MRPSHPPEVFYFANGAEPEAIDPGVAYDSPGIDLARDLFEGLLNYDPATLDPVPGVALSYEVSPDQLRYVFHLRKEARWSDGRPVTAHDFVYAWLRVLRPETGAQYAIYLWDLKNGKAFYERRIADPSLVGVRARDDLTLEVELERPVPYFISLTQFATLFPVRQDVVEAHGASWTLPEHLVGNGAYTLKNWKVSDSIELRKNPLYWDAPRVSIERAVALATDDNHAVVNMFRTGQLDWTGSNGSIPSEYLGSLSPKKDFHRFPHLATYFYWFQCQRPPFTDRRVRLALALAVDKEAIVKYVTRAGQPVTNHLVPDMMKLSTGYVPPPGPARDPEQARRLLAEAGYPGGKGFPRVELVYNTSEEHRAIAEAIQQMWKRELGVEVTLANQEWKVFVNNRIQGFFDIARAGWVADYAEPFTFLGLLLSDSDLNEAHYKNPAYDALVAQAKAATDLAERNRLYAQAEALLLEDMPFIPLYTYTREELLKPYVKGFYPNVGDLHLLKDFRLEY